jgi:hypothetical protein
MTEEFPEKEIIAYMKSGYRNGLTDIESLETLIDQVVRHLIRIRVREDKEFKLALGDGYYL